MHHLVQAAEESRVHGEVALPEGGLKARGAFSTHGSGSLFRMMDAA